MVQISARVMAAMESTNILVRFLTEGAYASKRFDPHVSNFVLGNPQEMPIPGISAAIKRWTEPQNKDWYAYKDSEASAQRVVAQSLEKRLKTTFPPENITMTNGAFAAISLCMATLIDPGDEVIYNSPPWFFYEPIIKTWAGCPVKVSIDRNSFDLDLLAIERAITKRTRVVIINSPHNPTGRIYSSSLLEKLSDLLSAKAALFGRPIYVLSDESYCRIVFDDQQCPSIAQFHPSTLLVYTYAKTLLCPGQRMGYIALPSQMPEGSSLAKILYMASLSVGYMFPNAVMQYAIDDLENLSIDRAALQRRRDYMISELVKMGYDVNIPQGTFYIIVRSPIDDDYMFCEQLSAYDILCLPGAVFEMPGFFRISLTASDAMVEASLPGFKLALEHVSSSSRKKPLH